jgi:hypothetical protein
MLWPSVASIKAIAHRYTSPSRWKKKTLFQIINFVFWILSYIADDNCKHPSDDSQDINFFFLAHWHFKSDNICRSPCMCSNYQCGIFSIFALLLAGGYRITNRFSSASSMTNRLTDLKSVLDARSCKCLYLKRNNKVNLTSLMQNERCNIYAYILSDLNAFEVTFLNSW